MKISIISVIIGLCGTALSAPVSDASIVERGSLTGLGPLGCGLHQQYSYILGKCISKPWLSSGILFGKGNAGAPSKRDEDKRSAVLEIPLNLICPIGQKFSLADLRCVNVGHFRGVTFGDKDASGPSEPDQDKRWLGAELIPNMFCASGERYSATLKKCVKTGHFVGVTFGDKNTDSPTKRDEEKRYLGNIGGSLSCPVGQHWSYILRTCIRNAPSFTGIVAGDKNAGLSAPKDEGKHD